MINLRHRRDEWDVRIAKLSMRRDGQPNVRYRRRTDRGCLSVVPWFLLSRIPERPVQCRIGRVRRTVVKGNCVMLIHEVFQAFEQGEIDILARASMSFKRCVKPLVPTLGPVFLRLELGTAPSTPHASSGFAQRRFAIRGDWNADCRTREITTPQLLLLTFSN